MARVHLVVLIHGLYGNPENLVVVKEELERASQLGIGPGRKGKQAKGSIEEVDEVEDLLSPPSSSSSLTSSTSSKSTTSSRDKDGLELKILVCKSFTGSHTWDGIDINAHKAAAEVDEVIKELGSEGKVVEVFSVVCLLSLIYEGDRGLIVDGIFPRWMYVSRT